MGEGQARSARATSVAALGAGARLPSTRRDQGGWPRGSEACHDAATHPCQRPVRRRIPAAARAAAGAPRSYGPRASRAWPCPPGWPAGSGRGPGGRESRCGCSSRPARPRSRVHSPQTPRASRSGALAVRKGSGEACIGRGRRISPGCFQRQTSRGRACRSMPPYHGGGWVETRLRSPPLRSGGTPAPAGPRRYAGEGASRSIIGLQPMPPAWSISSEGQTGKVWP